MSDKTLDQDYEAIRRDVSQLRSDITALLQSVSASGKASMENAKDEAGEKLKQNADRVTQQAKEIGSRVENQYEEKPFLFMIGAFLIGIILGRIFTNH